MWVAFAKATHIFSAKILAYMPYLIINFNDMLTNNIVSFEQLGPGLFSFLLFFCFVSSIYMLFFSHGVIEVEKSFLFPS